MKRKTALVTGGAGYVGSHTAAVLRQLGWDTVILDDLARGHRMATRGGELFQGRVGDKALLSRIFKERAIDAVLHFASLTYVGESVENPALYYRNNVSEGLTLLEAMEENGVKFLVFSSTAAVYGEPESVPIPEDHPTAPLNPYGFSKLAFERIAGDMAATGGIRPVFLRYFNAAGASPDGDLGEDHKPETHLIPLVIDTALGRRDSITIFGTDYPTADGTCVRDYIHVTDLAEAHALALGYLENGGGPGAFNLGSETGHSVRQVIDMVEKVGRKKVCVMEGPRREGDPSTLVASSEKARKILGWSPKLSDLESIVKTAWQWRASRPGGYGD